MKMVNGQWVADNSGAGAGSAKDQPVKVVVKTQSPASLVQDTDSEVVASGIKGTATTSAKPPKS